jgi:hypothetical protein
MRKKMQDYHEIFNKNKRYALLYLYLLHKPNWSYSVAKDFKTFEKILEKLRLKGVTEGNKVSQDLKAMHGYGLLTKGSSSSPVIERNVTYKINPFVLLSAEVRPLVWVEITKTYVDAIKALTPSGLSWLEGIIRLEKFNLSTLLCYFRFLVRNIDARMYISTGNLKGKLATFTLESLKKQRFLDFSKKKEEFYKGLFSKIDSFANKECYARGLDAIILNEFYREQNPLLRW